MNNVTTQIYYLTILWARHLGWLRYFFMFQKSEFKVLAGWVLITASKDTFIPSHDRL